MSQKKRLSNRTALEVVQDAMHSLGKIERMILDAKAQGRRKTSTGLSDADALRITDAIMSANWYHFHPLNDWAKTENFWVHFQRIKARKARRYKALQITK